MELRRLEQMLAMLGGGFLPRLHAALAQSLRNLEDYVKDQNKDATLTFNLTVKFSLGRDGLLRMTGNYDLKEPKEPAAAGVAWLDDGALSARNPAQQYFDFPESARARDTGATVIEGNSAPVVDRRHL